MATMTIKVEMRVGWRLRFLAHVPGLVFVALGAKRLAGLIRWALDGARYRVGGGPWLRMEGLSVQVEDV